MSRPSTFTNLASLTFPLLACAAMAGCYRDLDLAICRKNPSDPVCFADTSTSDTMTDGVASETSAGDSVVPTDVSDSSIVDTGAADASVEVLDATAIDSTNDVIDSYPPDIDDASAHDTIDAADAAPRCDDAGAATQPCGKCGTQTRACIGAGVWSPWGTCTSEGACAPGEIVEVAGTCPGALEKRFRTCNDSCSWGAEACRLQPGWTPIATPQFTARRTPVVWTGAELLVFGGTAGLSGAALGDGKAYSLATNTWTAMASANPRSHHVAVWTGTRLLAWGGQTQGGEPVGEVYDRASDSWTPMASAPITTRLSHAAVWSTTTNQMIVWGGYWSDDLADGAAYDPSTNEWTPLPTSPLAGRSQHAMVWTGTEVLVWGGMRGGANLADGALYNPTTKTWRALPASPLTGRFQTTAVLVDGGALLFGGIRVADPLPVALSDGANLTTGSSPVWTPLPLLPGAFVPRGHAAWCRTGTGFLLFSGRRMTATDESFATDGWAYDVSTGNWSALPSAAAPSPRIFGQATWTGKAAIVWGGLGPAGGDAGGEEALVSGAVYSP